MSQLSGESFPSQSTKLGTYPNGVIRLADTIYELDGDPDRAMTFLEQIDELQPHHTNEGLIIEARCIFDRLIGVEAKVYPIERRANKKPPIVKRPARRKQKN